MPINPNIALSGRPIELQNPLDQYSKFAAIRNAMLDQERQNTLAPLQIETAQNQNRLAQHQFTLKEQEDARERTMYNELAKADTPEKVSAVVHRYDPVKGLAYDKALIEKTTADQTQKKNKIELDQQMIRTAINNISSFQNTGDALAAIDRHLKKGDIDKHQAENLINLFAYTPFPQAKQLLLANMMDAEKRMPKPFTTDSGDATTYGVQDPITGAPTFTGEVKKKMPPGKQQELEDVQTRIGLERDRIVIARAQAEADKARNENDERRTDATERRLALAEDQLRLANDPAHQRRLAEAKANGDAIGKGGAAAQQALTKVISQAETAIKSIDELIGKRDKNGELIKGAAPHPGFNDAVGATWRPGMRFIPGTNAADFSVRFDQTKNASFLTAFESLRGGGAISNTEGEKGTSAINRASLAQSEEEFVAAMREVQDIVRRGVMKAQTMVGLSNFGPGNMMPAHTGAKFIGFEERK